MNVLLFVSGMLILMADTIILGVHSRRTAPAYHMRFWQYLKRYGKVELVALLAGLLFLVLSFLL